MVAVALHDSAGRVLLQRRPAGKRHADLWEFPGGKVESGENPRFALVRECREELGIELDPASLKPSGFSEEAGAGGHPGVVLILYRSAAWQNDPVAREGQEWGWFARDRAEALDLAPMDRSLLQGL